MANYTGLDKGYVVTNATVAKYRAVELSAGTPPLCKQATTDGVDALGVAQEDVSAADAATGKRVMQVRVEGVSKAIAGAAIALGARVQTTNAGKFITAASGKGVCGRALTAAAADGDWFELEISHGSVVA